MYYDIHFGKSIIVYYILYVIKWYTNVYLHFLTLYLCIICIVNYIHFLKNTNKNIHAAIYNKIFITIFFKVSLITFSFKFEKKKIINVFDI